jgi:hypothetical protein
MTLRLVKEEPPERPKRYRRPPLFDEAQHRALRASLRTLQGSFGTWRRLASAMGMRPDVLIRAASSRGRVSAEMAIRASRAARQPLESLISPGPRRA